MEILLDFLTSMPDEKVWVVVSEKAEGRNQTIFGDWFVADSRVPRNEGYHQTVFNWHAPSARRAAIAFDREFQEICRSQKISDPKQSRRKAILEIKKRLQECNGKSRRSGSRFSIGKGWPAAQRRAKRKPMT